MTKIPIVIREIDKYSSVTNYLELNGYEYRNEVIEQKVVEANLRISRKLNIPLATKVFMLKRVRYVEGIPMTIETTFHLYRDVENIVEYDFSGRASLNTVIEANTHLRVCKSTEKLSLALSTPLESQLLNINEKSQILLIKGNQWDQQGKSIEYFEIVALPEFYRFKGSRPV